MQDHRLAAFGASDRLWLTTCNIERAPEGLS
jgi:hypothetical protein